MIHDIQSWRSRCTRRFIDHDGVRFIVPACLKNLRRWAKHSYGGTQLFNDGFEKRVHRILVKRTLFRSRRPEGTACSSVRTWFSTNYSLVRITRTIPWWRNVDWKSDFDLWRVADVFIWLVVNFRAKRLLIFIYYLHFFV